MQSKPYSVVDGTSIAANGSMLETASARRHAKNHGANLLQEPMPTLRDSIPAKDICDQAIDGYFRTFEPMFRILHVPSFMTEYETYWTQAGPPSTEFLMKLTMVLTIGAIFLSDRSVANGIKRTARNWAYAVQWWLTGPTERDAMSIDGIQVFCLLVLARQTSALGGTASIMTEALSKLSFTLGLHVDPRFHSSTTPFESEIRRRLWLTVLELMAITSLNSTLPLLLNISDYQVPLPSNTADSELGRKPNSDSPQKHTKYDELDCSLQLMLAKSLPLRMQIIQDLNDESREATFSKAIMLSNNLQTHCRELAAFFQPDKEDDDNNNDDDDDDDDAATQSPNASSPNPNFHHKFLDTYLRRLILFLHRPFSHQARKDHRYSLARKTCLESSLIMASHTWDPSPSLSSPLPPDDFALSCMSGGGLFKGALGQDVILSISLEIVTQLEEEAEEEEGCPAGEGEGEGRGRGRGRGVMDPLAALARDRRRPLLRYLRRARARWRDVIRLGRPSLKQYLFASCILSHIDALESRRRRRRDPKAAILETIRRELRACTALLRESPAYAYAYAGDGEEEVGVVAATAAAAAWEGDDGGCCTATEAVDAMALFGFDFGALDTAFDMDMPVWADTQGAADDAHGFV
ncbi:putative C6 transcription [Rosellinia necatrix]|uniref:Putative C6 transcription n=1 Tax=Rosellinia necatrix TaxID=77044 RepID=A0A1W2TQC3_ROSNE|nr:putative C6 transcription [Rosellinia necatrix]